MRSLRIRLLIAFTLLAGLTAAAVAGAMYVNARNVILQKAQDAAVLTFTDNLAKAVSVHDIFDGMSSRDNTVVVFYRGRPAPGSRNYVSKELRERVRSGRVAWQRVELLGEPNLVIGAQVGEAEVYVVRSMVPEQIAIGQLATRAWLIGIFAVVAATLLALYAAWTVLGPVRELNAAALRLGQGDLSSRVAVRGNDELAAVAKTFNNTADALEKQVADAKRFVADVSHELRTPLAAMIAVTDVLDEEAIDLGTDAGKAARLVSQETRNLTRLVEDLMEISRFDSGTAALSLDNVDISAAIGSALRTRGWTDEVTVDLQPVVARVDPRRLDVIVANLVGNALKHGAPPVTVRLFNEPGWLTIEVSDHGTGLDPDVLPYVFNRFYKADTARTRSEGSGLGLAIAWENAHLHHGTLSAANGPGGGGVFTLRLPNQGGAG
ncbi:two-component system sensor histidine kinase MtrB [Kibdelosporangium banguiense]|uniref:histidine kinase n=1 Tax=Kibdelosporangium banguiense TaxID=1365924 RepID=A0ABS4U282_9PSEU|nr:HAMP domain-containing sensor histidine kinase [Kibdelosporangium banguiense]MBP2330730.1 two-component system sensor histidine kinase MtrB [Kibdelosporangium banguiense]